MIIDNLIKDLDFLYNNLHDEYDIYAWLDGFYKTLVNNNCMTKVPLEEETYNKTTTYKRAYDGKVIAEQYDYKEVKNTHGYHNLETPEHAYLIYPDKYEHTYSGFRDNFVALLMYLSKQELSVKQTTNITLILENILNNAIPFGTLSASTDKYIENDAEYSSLYYEDYKYDTDVPIKALYFNTCRRDCIDSLIKFCLKLKDFERGIDIFIKYQNVFNFDSLNLISSIKSAKSAWGKYLPNEYEEDLICIFENLSLPYLYKIKEILSTYTTIETDKTILPKVIFVLKKIFKSLEEETKKAEKLRNLRNPPNNLQLLEMFKKNEFVELNNFVKSLNKNSSLEDVKKVTTSSKFSYVLDCYNSVDIFPPFINKIPLINWINIYVYDFEEYVNIKNNRFENEFIIKTIQKTIDNNIDKQINSLYEKSKELKVEEIDALVKEFFLSCKDIEDYYFDIEYTKFCQNLNIKLNEYIEKIKNNNLIYNVLGFSQYLLKNNSYSAAVSLDFTGLATQQIKIVERYLKEVLVQFYPDSIYKVLDSEGKNLVKINFNKDNFTDLTAEDLSLNSKYFIKQNGINADNKLELGATSLALQHNYIQNQNYNGILKPFKNNFDNKIKLTNNKFQSNFISKVRNGYFHIHTMGTYQDAVINSKKAAYWLLRCIDEAPGKIK